MIGANLKRALDESIARHETPLLSLYLDVNPANPDNTGKAYVLRAAEAMRRVGLGKDYISSVTDKLSKEHVIPEGRSLVVFAGQDTDELFQSHYLQSRLPLLGRTDGALAHWGAPFTAPLLYLLDQRERHAVIYVSEDRVRVLEAFLGQIADVSDHERQADTDEWQPYRHARRSPGVGASVAARGGADVDRYQDRLREASARHYRSLMPELEKALEREGVDRVILMGTPAPSAAFEETMSAGIRKRVTARLPAPPDPDAAAHEWLPLVKDVIDEAEAQRELALLDRARESGVAGRHETLSLLQQHRLRTVLVPWVLNDTVYQTESGHVALSEEEAGVLYPGEPVTQVRLLEVLPGLAADSGAAIEFTDGPAEQRLLDEFGGMAGLKHAG